MSPFTRQIVWGLLMRIFAMISAAILAAGQVQAATFTFSFYNWANGGGDVTGVVRGLADNATSAASSVEILSNTAGFGLGEYVGTASANQWTTKNGKLLDFEFLAESLLLVRWLESGRYWTEAGLSEIPGGLGSAGGGITHLKFDPPLGEVPLPASLSLLAGALLGLRMLQRRYQGPAARQGT